MQDFHRSVKTETPLWRVQTNLVYTKTQGKGAVVPQERLNQTYLLVWEALLQTPGSTVALCRGSVLHHEPLL